MLSVDAVAGNSLENVMKNPALQDLVGGLESVTLGACLANSIISGYQLRYVYCATSTATMNSKASTEQSAIAQKNAFKCDQKIDDVKEINRVLSWDVGDEEARRRGVQKSVLERAAPPTFDVAIEIIERGRWRVHTDVGEAVDQLLRGQVSPETLLLNMHAA